MNLIPVKTINLDELVYDILIVALPYLYSYILGNRLLLDIISEYTGYIGLIFIFCLFSHTFSRYLYGLKVAFWNYNFTYQSLSKMVKALYSFSAFIVYISLSVIGFIIVQKGYGGFSLNSKEFLPSIAILTLFPSLIIPPLFNFLSKGEISFLANLLIVSIFPIFFSYLYYAILLTDLLSTGIKIVDVLLFLLNFFITIPVGIALIYAAMIKMKNLFIGESRFDNIKDTISSITDFIKSSSEKIKITTNTITTVFTLTIFGEISFGIFMKPEMKEYATTFFFFFITGILPTRFLMMIKPPVSIVNIIIGLICSYLYLQSYFKNLV